MFKCVIELHLFQNKLASEAEHTLVFESIIFNMANLQQHIQMCYRITFIPKYAGNKS
jgi:hypothetical protein